MLRPAWVGMIVLVASSCDPSAQGLRAEEDRLIRKLVEGGPREKMAAAVKLKRLGCKRSVPYLLAEARDHYPKVIIEGELCSPDVKAFVIQEGKKTPYIDYHEPLFGALSTLAVPYFEPDRAWFEAIDTWIEVNLPKHRPHPTHDR